MNIREKIFLSIVVFVLVHITANSQSLYDFSNEQYLKEIESLYIDEPLFDVMNLFQKYKMDGSNVTVYHDMEKWQAWTDELFERSQEKVEWEIETNTDINTYKTVLEDSLRFKSIKVHVTADGNTELTSQGRGEIFGIVHLYLFDEVTIRHAHPYKENIIYVNTEKIRIYDASVDEFANEVLNELDTLLKEFTIDYLKAQNIE